MEMTSADRAILGLLNNPKIIPPNDIIQKYTVASFNEVELLVVKVFLNINVDYQGEHGAKSLYDNNFDFHKISNDIRTKILKPLGLLKSIYWGVLIVIDVTGDKIIEYPIIKQKSDLL
jgi:hypothetical protein